jgi:hypothetical protein
MPQHLGATPPETASPGPSDGLGQARSGRGVPNGRGGVGAAASPLSEPCERAAIGVPLPCPPKRNNSIEPAWRIAPAAARTAHALQVNVADAVRRWSLERTGFLTLTFADHVTCPQVAQQRMNSLTTNVLRPRYGEAIRVYERQKSGRIHYHLLVNVGVDIRTGFDFGAIKKHDYRSASVALRNEWAFWRLTAKDYKFGRTELLPVISSSAAVSRYVGKYISKHVSVREERDLGVRLVSYIGPKVASVKFAWAGPRGRGWRVALEALVRDLAANGQIDEVSCEAMRRAYGAKWLWSWKEIIAGRACEMERARDVVDELTGEIK